MTRKIIVGALVAATAAIPAAATADPGKDKGKAKGKDKDKSAYCMPKSVGYNARGSFVSGSLTQTAGADTTKRGDDRYSGQLVVDVKKANQKGLTGEQTFTLTNARAKFHPRNDTDVAAGDRVKLKGKVTKLGKKCDDTAFQPTVTVRKVDFKAKRS